MHFLLNLLFAFIAWYLADYLLARAGVTDPPKLIIAIVVGVVVFLANLAGHLF